MSGTSKHLCPASRQSLTTYTYRLTDSIAVYVEPLQEKNKAIPCLLQLLQALALHVSFAASVLQTLSPVSHAVSIVSRGRERESKLCSDSAEKHSRFLPVFNLQYSPGSKRRKKWPRSTQRITAISLFYQ